MSSEKELSQVLDRAGQKLSPEFYQSFSTFLDAALQQGALDSFDFVENLKKDLTVVYDANIVQKAIRHGLKKKTISDLIATSRLGFITPLAPRLLDDEISKHAHEIASDCHTTPSAVLKYYLDQIRPHLKLVDTSEFQILDSIRADLKDKDDAPYIAVHLMYKTAGVVTEDKGVKRYLPEAQTFSVQDICRTTVLYKQQYVVLVINAVNIAILTGIIFSIFKILKNYWKHILISAGILAVVAAIYRLVDEEGFENFSSSLLEKITEAKEKTQELLVAIEPFLIAYFQEYARREKALAEGIRPLTTGTRNSISKKKTTQNLTYHDLLRMIVNVHGNRPLLEKEICLMLGKLGYPVRGKQSIRGKVRKNLKESGLYLRSKDRRYKLITQTSPQQI